MAIKEGCVDSSFPQQIEVIDRYSQTLRDKIIQVVVKKRSKNFICQSELRAVKAVVPENRHGMEIGVGTGIFASPLNIKVGVEPSKKLAEMARTKGITVFEDFAER